MVNKVCFSMAQKGQSRFFMAERYGQRNKQFWKEAWSKNKFQHSRKKCGQKSKFYHVWKETWPKKPVLTLMEEGVVKN
jgi:hypothetical protein